MIARHPPADDAGAGASCLETIWQGEGPAMTILRSLATRPHPVTTPSCVLFRASDPRKLEPPFMAPVGLSWQARVRIDE